MVDGFSPRMLAGRRVACTGASSGIGRRFAIAAAELGADVFMIARDVGRLEQTRAAMTGSGHEFVAMDVSDCDEVSDRLQSVGRRMGGFDGVFHAAGTELIRPLRMTKADSFEACFGASFRGALGICRAAASKDTMRSDGGALVLMSSVAGLRGQVGMAAYSATKAAVDGLVRSAALELAPKRIRVNAIASGAVVTEMHERITGKLELAAQEAYAYRHPLGLGEPADVVGLALFLMSDMGKWITGTTMVVDGGYCVR